MATTNVGETTFIYTLAHPLTGQVRYVGKANNLKHRYNLHLRKDERTAKCCWVQSLLKKGLVPVIEVLDIVPQSEWQFWEMYWISQIKAWGHVLYNGDNGGLGTDRLPQSVRDKISSKLTGKKIPLQHVKYAQYDIHGNYIQTFSSTTDAANAVNGSNSNLKRAHDKGLMAYGFLWLKVKEDAPEKIESRYDSNGRFICSEETRIKRRESARGRGIGKVASAETRLKQRLARLGKSPANKGVAATPEQKRISRDLCPNKKPVDQLGMDGTLIKRWGSIKEASQKTGATRAGILNTAKGKYRYSAGFKWRF